MDVKVENPRYILQVKSESTPNKLAKLVAAEISCRLRTGAGVVTEEQGDALLRNVDTLVTELESIRHRGDNIDHHLNNRAMDIAAWVNGLLWH